MKKIILLSFLFTSCSSMNFTDRGEITQLKRNLNYAQKDLEEQSAYIKKLEVEIAKKEIEAIKKELRAVNVHQAAKEMLTSEDWSSFFYPQREVLSQIIEETPACRTEAQEVLDQILTLITQLSDQADLVEEVKGATMTAKLPF